MTSNPVSGDGESSGGGAEAVFAHMAAFADSEYVRGCHIARRDECKGWEHKAKTGKFGPAEYEAHKQFDEAMGAHFGIYKAIEAARAALASTAKGI